MSRIQNPSSTDKKSEIQYLGFGIFSVEFRIQDCLGLLYMKQFTKTPRFDDNQAKFIMNEIQPFKSLKVVPCELSCKNMISWHMKVTCYFQMWKDHRCYGYIINRAFCSKKIIKWNILAFIGVYIKNRTLHGCLEIRNFSSCVENKWNIFQYEKRNFVSLRTHVISSINPWSQKRGYQSLPLKAIVGSTPLPSSLGYPRQWMGFHFMYSTCFKISLI